MRCSACGETCTAALPDEAGTAKDRPRARAVFAVRRSDLGLPFSRVPGSQALLGVPVAEATPWDQIAQVGDWRSRVLASRERVAAQGARISQDDTAGRMVSLMEEHGPMRAAADALGRSRPTERTGRCPTAWVVQVGERMICLDASGRSHAGETLTARLEQRQASLDTPLGMSDALSRHEADAAGRMRCPCLAHGRRQCSDLEDVFPTACQGVIEARNPVFDHEDEAREQQMRPTHRVVSHQASRQPMMDERTHWLQQRGADRLVEPHSS